MIDIGAHCPNCGDCVLITNAEFALELEVDLAMGESLSVYCDPCFLDVHEDMMTPDEVGRTFDRMNVEPVGTYYIGRSNNRLRCRSCGREWPVTAGWRCPACLETRS